MNSPTAATTADAVRKLIVCDTQFSWTGTTTLKLQELLDLQARGWLAEGDENNEFDLTGEGRAVVAQALQFAVPATLGTVKPGGSVQLAGRGTHLPQTKDERTRFETWAAAKGLDPSVRLMLTSHPPQDGGYADASLQRLWEAWQAALAGRQPDCETCGGWGRIGGPSFYAPDDGGEPCPECTTTCDMPAGQETAPWQPMATCPRDGTVVLLRWGEDHASPGWWCAPDSPVQNEDGTWSADNEGFPWAFFDINGDSTFVNHAVDTEYGPTHWAPYTTPPAQGSNLERALDLMWNWQEQLAGHVFDARDVARTLTSSDMQAIGVDAGACIDATDRNQAIVLAKREIVRALINNQRGAAPGVPHD